MQTRDRASCDRAGAGCRNFGDSANIFLKLTFTNLIRMEMWTMTKQAKWDYGADRTEMYTSGVAVRISRELSLTQTFSQLP